MKKTIIITSILLLYVGLLSAQLAEKAVNEERYTTTDNTITVGSKTCTLDTLEHRRVGPGTTYTSFYLKELPVYVYILKLDLRNPYNGIETFLANDKIGGTELVTKATKRLTNKWQRAYCGINGDFFNVTDHHEFPLGAPRGGSANNGVMHREPRNSWWSIAAITRNKEPFIDHVEFVGTVDAGAKGTYNFYDVNVPRAYCSDCEMTFFNYYAGGATRFDENYSMWMGVERTEVYITLADAESWSINQPVKCIVGETIENEGGNPIALHQSVLSGVGNARTFLQQLKPGDEITVQMGIRSTTYNDYPLISQMVGGNAVLLREGVPTLRNETEAYNASTYPRTIVASSKDKRWLYLLVADGKTSASRGLTTYEACDILKHWGAYDAVGLDGGGSSEMIVNYEVANKPADGKERSVGNGWLVIDSSQDSDEITELDFWNHKFELPRYAIINPVVMGFNEYGRLINDNLSGVQLTCSPEIGHIDNGSFVASGTASSGILTAHYGGLEVSKEVTVMNGSNFNIRLDSVLLDDKTNYPIEVYTQLNGKDVLMDHKAFEWVVANDEICKVEQGVLSAISNGSSLIEGALNDFKGVLKANVEITDQSSLPIATFDDEALELVSNIKNITKSATDILNIHYTYSTTRVPYFQLEKKVNLYSKPTSLRFVFNPHDIPVDKITINFSVNNNSTAVIKEYSNILPNIDNTIEIPIEDIIGETDDVGNWPVKFNSFKVVVTAGGHTVGNDYDFDMKDFSTIYKDNETGVEEVLSLQNNEISIEQQDGRVYVKLNLSSPELVTYELYSISGMKLMMDNYGVCQNGSFPIGEELVDGQVYLLKVNHGISSSIFKFIKQ